MPYRRRISFISLLLATLLLSSCGFHLRGADSNNIPVILIRAEPSALVTYLKTELKHMRIAVTNDAQHAIWEVSIQEGSRERRVMSVDSRGKAQEYELRQSVVLNVIDLKNNRLLTHQTIHRSRDLLFDKTEVLGKDYEESLLYEDIEKDIINATVWNLRALAKAINP